MLAPVPRTLVALAFAVSISSLAFAQAPAAPQPESQPAPITPLPSGTNGSSGSSGASGGSGGSGGSGASGGAAPATDAPAKAPVREATGYAPSSIPSASGRGGARKSGKSTRTTTKHHGVDRKAQTGAFVVEPGFRLLDGGGSRFFVELGQAVGVEERKAKGALSFVLKGARNAYRNNYNPLVTEHFNTPVRRAKLAPAGHDLVFTLELRQDVPAKQFGVVTEGGHAFFQVDFDPGTFVKEPAKPLPEPSADADAERDGQGQGQGAAGNANAEGNETVPSSPAPRAPRTKGAGPKP